MSSSPPESPSTRFGAGRAKFIWIGIAGLLTVWLIIMLATSSGGKAQRFHLDEPTRAVPKGFDERAASALRSRVPVLESGSSAAVPLRIDDGKSQ